MIREEHDYVILSNQTAHGLAEHVKSYLEDGYKLAGGVSISHGFAEGFNFAQALYKCKEIHEKPW